MKVIALGGAMPVLVGCASKGEPIKPKTVNLGEFLNSWPKHQRAENSHQRCN